MKLNVTLHLFDGTHDTWNTEHVDLELQDPHLQAKFLGSQSARQKILHVMRKFLPFQADFRLIMRYAHTHADNFFMRMCASSRITT